MAASPTTIEATIATFQQAALLSRQAPARCGNIVSLSAEHGSEVMVTADLHGDRRNFNRILKLADLKNCPRRHLVMQEVCHGGPMYPGGHGCLSHLMLEDVARLKIEFPERFHFILSNHELAELTDFPIVKGKRMLNLLFRCGLQEMYGEAADEVRNAALEFLGSLPLAVRLSGGVFISHSVPEMSGEFDHQIFDRPLTDADRAEGGGAFRLVWGRDYSPANAQEFAKAVGAQVLITGHEPCRDGFQVPNDRQIVLDCCGPQACYVILPIDESLCHGDVVKQIERLHENSSPGR